MRNYLKKNIAVIAFLILIVFNCIFTQNFFKGVTFTNLIIQASRVVLVSLGMSLVIATGGIDISVGSAMSLGAIISAISMAKGEPIGILLSIGVVLLAGYFSGTLVARFAVLPMVATLAMRYIMRGMAKGISGRGTISYSNPKLANFFLLRFATYIPVQFFIILIAAVIMYLLVNKMKFGVYVEACGNNPIAARNSGINTKKVVTLCYVILALFSWGSGMLEMGVVSSANPATVGNDMELDAIAAVLVGGTPITGGYPNIIGAFFGAFLLQLINMMCNMHNVSSSVTLIIKALIIMAALFFHGLNKERR